MLTWRVLSKMRDNGEQHIPCTGVADAGWLKQLVLRVPAGRNSTIADSCCGRRRAEAACTNTRAQSSSHSACWSEPGALAARSVACAGIDQQTCGGTLAWEEHTSARTVCTFLAPFGDCGRSTLQQCHIGLTICWSCSRRRATSSCGVPHFPLCLDICAPSRISIVSTFCRFPFISIAFPSLFRFVPLFSVS